MKIKNIFSKNKSTVKQTSKLTVLKKDQLEKVVGGERTFGDGHDVNQNVGTTINK